MMNAKNSGKGRLQVSMVWGFFPQSLYFVKHRFSPGINLPDSKSLKRLMHNIWWKTECLGIMIQMCTF